MLTTDSTDGHGWKASTGVDHEKHEKPDSEEAASRAGYCSEGEWYNTGDRVEIVGQAPLRFRLTGRTGGGVNVGGEKVNPAEIEAEIRAHPAVHDVRVFGRANSVTGHVLAAEVVTRRPVEEAELRAFLGERLHGAKLPRLYSFVLAIERTRTGKTVRAEKQKS